MKKGSYTYFLTCKNKRVKINRSEGGVNDDVTSRYLTPYYMLLTPFKVKANKKYHLRFCFIFYHVI